MSKLHCSHSFPFKTQSLGTVSKLKVCSRVVNWKNICFVGVRINELSNGCYYLFFSYRRHEMSGYETLEPKTLTICFCAAWLEFFTYRFYIYWCASWCLCCNYITSYIISLLLLRNSITASFELVAHFFITQEGARFLLRLIQLMPLN